jgi:hypothetical protein
LLYKHASPRIHRYTVPGTLLQCDEEGRGIKKMQLVKYAPTPTFNASCADVIDDQKNLVYVYLKNISYLKAGKEGGDHAARIISNYPICLTSAKVDSQVRRSSLHPPNGLAQPLVTHLGYSQCQRLPSIRRARIID